jgi:predicted TPR repeat methyltransferase
MVDQLVVTEWINVHLLANIGGRQRFLRGEQKLTGGDSEPGKSTNELLSEAIARHRQGFLDEAQSVYRQVLRADPKNPDALHYLGLVYFQRGELKSAVDSIRDALRYAPQYVDAYNNLGSICQELGQIEEAEFCYRKVIELWPGHADSHSNLGVVLKTQGRTDDAIACYREPICIDPSHAQAHNNLGNLLRHGGHTAEAIAHYRSAIEFAKLEGSEARNALVNTLRHEGHVEAAREVLDEWLELEPEHPIALHILASMDDQLTPARASDDYVRTMFDHMAKSFDEHLDDLDYRAHTLVTQALLCALDDDRKELVVLDAGCGTGLCGPMVRAVAKRLVGVDLSSKMLRRAVLTKAYDELIEAELTEFLIGSPSTYDVIICADTLCYFGDLDKVMKAAAESLLAGGRLVFTVEHWEAADDRGYLLNPHGRYSHGQDYIRDVIARSGLDLELMNVETLRREVGAGVDGLLVSCRRPRVC